MHEALVGLLWAFAGLGVATLATAYAVIAARAIRTVRMWRDAWYRETTRTLAGRS